MIIAPRHALRDTDEVLDYSLYTCSSITNERCQQSKLTFCQKHRVYFLRGKYKGRKLMIALEAGEGIVVSRFLYSFVCIGHRNFQPRDD